MSIADTNDRIHKWTGPTGQEFVDVAEASGTYYRLGTPRIVIDELERAREQGKRVRLFYGDNDTGRDWGEENDVCGRVGRSMGPIKIPLLLVHKCSTCGSAILTDSIVRLIVDGREVYRHDTYFAPSYRIGEPWNGLDVGVYANDEATAGFKTETAARRWIDFMTGKRLCK